MKTIFTLLATLIIFNVQAQNFHFEPTDTLEKTIAVDDVSDLNINIIRHDNIDTLRLHYELMTNTLPEKWYQGYCDNHGCWGSLPESGEMSAMYDDLNSFIKLSINPNEVEGSGTVQYYVYQVDDYDNGLLMTFNIDTPGFVGIDDIAGVDFKFFPNPIENQLFIESNEQISKISIYNLMGKVIFQKEHHIFARNTIDASQWQSGIYFLEVVNAKGITETKKLVKR